MKTKEEIEKYLEDKKNDRKLLELEISECDKDTEDYIIEENLNQLNILNARIYTLAWVLE